MTTSDRNFLQSLWDFFCSLKLTMFLLISLAVISIIGTVVPQGTPPPEYLATITQAKYQLYRVLGFFDMYHSWWFVLLLYLLTVNLIACSVKRLPHIWKFVSQPALTLSSGLEQSLPNRVTYQTIKSPEALKESLAALLKDQFAAPVVTELDGSWHLFAQKAPWCRLSVYVVHLSVIIIFIGAMIGSLFGYKGYVNITEGESVSSIRSRTDKPIDLGFALRLEQFSVAHYKTGAPKEFKSIITVLENGQPVPDYTNVRVIVNDPLTYKGITFYQSSYGDAGNHYFTVSYPGGKQDIPVTLGTQETATLPDGTTLRIVESTDDISRFVASLSGSAAQVVMRTPDGRDEKIVFYANYPELNANNSREHNLSVLVQYKGAEKRLYTGLQVARDPGVWIVWLGCALMVGGIYGAFLISHRRVWIRIQNGSVVMGGNASKNQAAFDQFYEELAQKVKQSTTTEEL